MKFLTALVLASTTFLASCGGGGGGGGTVSPIVDTAAPVIGAVNQTPTAGNTATLSAAATDNVAVTGYCFKTDNTAPLATDSCFQAAAQKAGASLAKGVTHYVWAKDAAGNVSASGQGSCSAAGFTASNATSKTVVCMLTDKGEVLLELDKSKAPITVANFLSFTNAGFYSNTTFHRVINGFVVQGGGFTYSGGSYSPKATTSAPIVLEKTSTTGLSNTRGTIAMARTSVANSATSQFFINVVDNISLDAAGQPDGNGYAVFGRVLAGMGVVDLIKAVPTGNVGGMGDAPVAPVYVQWAYQVQ